MITAENLKLKVKTEARNHNSQPQDIMQMYFFERLLYRISISKYKHNFILKGGLLLSAIFSDRRRTTQDMDTMIKGIDLNFEAIKKIIDEIVNVDIDDDIRFEVTKYKDIREQDKYGGIKVYLIGHKEHLQVPLSIDISINDPITPRELEFRYKSIFNDSYIKIMAYNIETIIAEKFETFITDNIQNTRLKDFYDIYMLMSNHSEEIDNKILIKAIKNTFKRRETIFDINNIIASFEMVKTSDELKNRYQRFQKANLYSNNISYENIMDAISKIVELLEQETAVSFK